MTEPQRGSTIYSQNANKMNPASSIEKWTLAKSAVKRRDGEKEMLTTEKTDSTEVNFGLLGTHKIGGFPTREFPGSGPAMWLATGCRSGGGMWRSGKIRSTEKTVAHQVRRARTQNAPMVSAVLRKVTLGGQK